MFGVIATIGLAFAGASAAGWVMKAAWGSRFLAGLASGLVMTVGGKIINSVFHLNSVNNVNERETSQTYSWNLPTIQTNEGGVIGTGLLMPSMICESAIQQLETFKML